MSTDFTLTAKQQRLRADARAFAGDVLSKVGSATKDLPTPLARFAATRPFYEQTIAAGFLRRVRAQALWTWRCWPRSSTPSMSTSR